MVAYRGGTGIPVKRRVTRPSAGRARRTVTPLMPRTTLHHAKSPTEKAHHGSKKKFKTTVTAVTYRNAPETNAEACDRINCVSGGVRVSVF